MLGKVAALLIILVAVVAFFALNFIDPEPTERLCPSCGTKTLVVVKESVGSATVLRCTTCQCEVIVHG